MMFRKLAIAVEQSLLGVPDTHMVSTAAACSHTYLRARQDGVLHLRNFAQ